ncbi:MAG: DEAD/DEAH box helicase [Alphaproteobacteria bacterium]
MTVQFQDLGLSPAVQKSIRALGFETPTPIQCKAIPLVLSGHDLMGLAQTGTGKTAAFGLPLMQQLLSKKRKLVPKTARALILAPTRELVNQIAANMRDYSHGAPLRISCVTGGASIRAQIKDLGRGTDILIATPGRLIDLMERKAIFLDTARYLVLDEADQMLDLGFIHALRQIAKMIGTPRQTLLFSATMPKQIEELSQAYLSDPVRVEVAAPGRAADKIRQTVHFIGPRSKSDLLKQCLGEQPDALSLVFARTKRGAERLMKHLVDNGVAADSIHGNKNQSQRDRAIRAFKNGNIRVLVATDVAARGIDIPGVSHVYNFDLPEVPENYVHRIGRTARAGADGEAVAFCGTDEVRRLNDIERLMGITIDVASGERPERMGGQAHRGAGKRQARGSSRPNGNSRGQPRDAARQGAAKAKPSSGGQKRYERPERPERHVASDSPHAASGNRTHGGNANASSRTRTGATDGANQKRPRWRRRPKKTAAA